MREVVIRVDSETQPIIPYIKVPYTPDANTKIRQRVVTFKVEGGTATVIIPVAGEVTSVGSREAVDFDKYAQFEVDKEGTTLKITQPNKVETIEIEYQILCNDNGNLYWAKGQSPPRMQIPPV
jgi:hypothetical protein